MTRSTSAAAYHAIQENGYLSERRWQVYDVLFNRGPLTATGIASKIPNFKSPSVGFNVHARLCELRSLGYVQELGHIECPHTGMTVINWDVTDRVEPLKIERKENKFRKALLLIWEHPDTTKAQKDIIREVFKK